MRWEEYPQAPEFLGLSVEAATTLAAEHDYVGPRIYPTGVRRSGKTTLEIRLKRLNLFVVDGHVTDAALF